jgi:HK97 gp10 family phage protein
MKSVRGEMAKRHDAVGFVVSNAAKKNAPVDTGRLRASITHDADADGVVIGTNVPYGGFQELGTRNQEGTPFLVPGLIQSIPTARDIYGGEA